MRTRKYRRILVKKKYINLLQEEFGVKQAAVYNALAYRTSNALSSKIRSTAINEYDGVEVIETKIDE